MDYRSLRGSWDRVVSVGMFEHVCRRNYGAFMDVVRNCLKPGGLFLLHSIGRLRLLTHSRRFHLTKAKRICSTYLSLSIAWSPALPHVDRRMRCRRIRALRLFLRTACIESEQTFTVPSLRSHCCRKQLGLPTALRSLNYAGKLAARIAPQERAPIPIPPKKQPTDNHRSRRSGQSAPLSRQTPLCTDPELSRLRCDILRTAPRRPARPNAPYCSDCL